MSVSKSMPHVVLVGDSTLDNFEDTHTRMNTLLLIYIYVWETFLENMKTPNSKAGFRQNSTRGLFFLPESELARKIDINAFLKTIFSAQTHEIKVCF